MTPNSTEEDRRKALRVCELAKAAGGKAFFVGGCVRDMLAGEKLTDYDVEVFGIEEPRLLAELGRSFKLNLFGKSYAVYKIYNSNIDIGLPRRERKTGFGHQSFEIDADPSMTIREAAERRDFTINSVYFDPLENEFFDPFDGRADWNRKILRHTTERFREDPLRPLRAMQFIARFNLKAAPETVRACSEIGMENLPPERIFEEWKKLLLKGVSISEGLEFLWRCGWAAHFPELAAMYTCPQEPKWHPEGSVWRHTLLCMDAFAKTRTGNEWEDLVIGFAVLLHDAGKCVTTLVEGGRIRSPTHDRVGVPIAENFLKKMTRHKKLVAEVLPLVRHHMVPHQLHEQNSSLSAVRRLSSKVQRIDRLIRVCLADLNGRGLEFQPEPENLTWLKRKAEEASIIDSAPKAIVMGRHLIEAGLKPGPDFKKILNQLYEAQMETCFSTLEEGLEFARNQGLLNLNP